MHATLVKEYRIELRPVVEQVMSGGGTRCRWSVCNHTQQVLYTAPTSTDLWTTSTATNIIRGQRSDMTGQAQTPPPHQCFDSSVKTTAETELQLSHKTNIHKTNHKNMI